MDLNTVTAVHVAATRAELWPLGDGDAVLGGGTWLYSEPQTGLRRLVDITAMGWEPVTIDAGGVQIAATATIERIAGLGEELPRVQPEWAAAPLIGQCCHALLASFKIWHTATIGGNLCLSFPAGAMISLLSALDGSVTVWRPDGSDYRIPVTDFVTGVSRSVLAPGEVLRSVHIPAAALRATTAFRKLAASPLGRSAVVVIGRRDAPADGGRFTLSITAATVRPYLFVFEAVPSAGQIDDAHATIPPDAWTLDAHGDPDWRRGVSLVLAQHVRAELG